MTTISKRSRTTEGGNLVPVTIRISAKDRDHLEHLARINSATLSEYIRTLLDLQSSSANIEQRLDRLEKLLTTAIGRQRGDADGFDLPVKMDAMHAQLMGAVARVERFTDLIQGSFEQLFDAFFKLQTYIEHILKLNGGRR